MPASTSTRSGHPAKKAAAKKAAARPAPKQLQVSTDWGEEGTELLEFPSGKVARIERIELTTLLAEGLLGDSLSVLASQAVERGQGMDEAKIREMGQDPQKIMEALDAFDKVAVKCFVEPAIAYYKDDEGKVIPKAEREEGWIYSDRIPLQDKIYLFQVISGGSSDLQRFRHELGESLAGLSAS